MKKSIKKIICMILCFAMIFTTLQTTMFSASAKVVGPDNKTELTITTDKSKYSWGDTIVFNIDVKNVSNETLTGIRISSLARNYMKLVEDGDAPVISKLEPGETTTVQVKYFVTKLVGVMAFFFPIIWLFSPAARILYRETPFNYEKKVKVGAIKYRIGFEVEYNYQSSTLRVDDGVFKYDLESGLFFPNSEVISGTTDKKSVTKVDFRIIDDKDIVISEGESDYKDGKWSFSNFSFRDGNNKLILTAIEDSKVVETLSIDVFSTVFINPENSKIDIKADQDGDGLIDYLEEYYGSNPRIRDTDNDGLTDYTEVYYLSYNPNSNDTDGNGIKDAQEDADGDGINNLKEQSIGTNPAYYDTDHDLLSDYDELYKYHTDPLKADTDDDGVDDGTEIKNGTDPNKKNTQFTETITPDDVNESKPVSAGAKVAIDSKGVGTLTINEVSTGENPLVSSNIPGYLGSAYNFTVDGELKSATLTFNYDSSLGEIGADFQPRIYYVNEESGELEELENQIVTNGKVVANVNHFSTYILLNKVEFDKVWNTEIKPTDYQGDGKTGIDIVFVVDSSGSMTSNDRSGIRKTAVKNFVDKLGKDDRAAVVDFDDSARVYQSFTSDHQALYSAVDRVDSSGGTSLSAGMKVAINLFKEDSYIRTDAYKYIVFLTDGDGDYRTAYTSEALKNNIIVYTVGLGSGVRETVLKNIASGTGGKYYFASTANQLPDIYNDVSFETVDYITDTNKDGISDYYTKLIDEGTLVLSNGSSELFGVLSMYGADNADWDGDGLKNGEEIEIVEGRNGPTIKMKSHPLHPDYDNDGYNDKSERNMGTDPFSKTHAGGTILGNLLDDGQSTSSLIGNHSLWKDISLMVYADKKKDSKNKLVDFFYKYASEEALALNAEAIKKVEIRASMFDTIEMLTNLGKLGKSIADLSVKYEVDTDSDKFKKSVQDLEAQRGYAIKVCKETNETGWDKLAKKEKDIIGIISSWDAYFVKLQKMIEDKAASTPNGSGNYDTIISEINNDAKLVNNAIGAVKSALGFFKLWKVGGKTIGKSLGKVTEYAVKTSAKDAFKLTTGDFIDVGFAVADYVNEVLDTADTYSKVQANSEAFTDYFDLLDYISNNNGYDYIRDAAGEVLSLVLGGSSEYWSQLAKAASEQFAKDFVKEAIDLGLSALSKTNPVLAVLKAILDIAVGELKATFKVEIEATTVDAITDACKHYLYQNCNISSDNIWYDVLDEAAFNLYLVHLVHGRIDGENILYSHCDELGLLSKSYEGWRILFTGHNRVQETKEGCKSVIQGNYKRANYLGVKYSNMLPFYAEYHSLTY